MLFAMLAGGDYNTGGVPNCGAEKALRALRSGLGMSLCNAKSQEDCNRWRQMVLLRYFKREQSNIAVPNDFTSFQVLQWYRNPKVTADDVLLAELNL